MHGNIFAPDAEYYRLQYSREAAHRRLVAQARSTADHQRTTGPRERLGRLLVSIGTRMQDATVSAPVLGAQPSGEAR